MAEFVESPIFTRTYDLLRWLIPVTVKFPRAQRFVLAANLQQTALRFQQHITNAAHAYKPRPHLELADAALSQLRTNLRLAHDLQLLSRGQYQHVSKMTDEIGKLLGGWLKKV